MPPVSILPAAPRNPSMDERLPPSAQKEFERAVSLFKEGRLATAEGICVELVARYPRDAELAHFAGVLANRMGRYDVAVARLTACVRAQPRRARAHAALGLAHEQLGHLEEARAAFATAVQAEPGFAEAHNGLGVALFKAKRFGEAAASFGRAIQLDARNVEARLNLARALNGLGRDAAAARCWHDAIALAPARDEVRRIAGLGLLDSGDRKGGVEALRAYLERVPDDALARSQLALALEVADPGEALREMSRSLAVEPVLPAVRNAHGTLLMRVGHFAEAREALEAVLAEDPASGEARLNLGLALRELGSSAESARYLTEAAAHLEGSGLAQLAAAVARGGDAVQAIELARRALAQGPYLADAHATLASESLRRGDIATGWSEYAWRPTRGNAIFEDVAAGRYPPALPSPLAGSLVAVRAEQGLGDVLFFLRYALPLQAAGARLHFMDVGERLQPLVSRAFPRATFGSADALPEGATGLWAGDLPHFVAPLTGRAIEPVVTLVPLPARVERMREVLGDTRIPMAGIAWRAGTRPRSGPVGQRLLSKEIDAQVFGRALAGLERRWVIVQRHPDAGEVARVEAALGAPVLDLSAANDDLEDLLALMALLDDYVGVSSTSVHLRAGTGRGGRILVPLPSDWRWQEDGDSPFFPGYAVYREQPDGWNGPLAALRRDLEENA